MPMWLKIQQQQKTAVEIIYTDQTVFLSRQVIVFLFLDSIAVG